MTRGGKREGSGRPAKTPGETRQTLTCRVKESNREWLYAQKEKTGVGVGDLVDLAIETLQTHPEKQFSSSEEE